MTPRYRAVLPGQAGGTSDLPIAARYESQILYSPKQCRKPAVLVDKDTHYVGYIPTNTGQNDLSFVVPPLE